ncbi:MAG TPA: polyphenol oxidase family protein [Candidatus Hydrogenedentes bacterium]|nr:polyphenol oxidase family protein [Candidatus Hydrogenedentota bacterium]HQH53342.1 polyphenol oxidase family protein [Candidatus Hydrogenedentota bacterium]
MIRFREFEALGVSIAAVTEREDGDCCDPRPGNARSSCCAALEISSESLVCCNQVHGASVAVVGEQERGRGGVSRDSALASTDGLVTAEPGLPLAVFVADCVPLFLFAPSFRVAGLVHAGRQGTRSNIAAAAIRVMENGFGVSPADVHALIGPSAGPELYEVSEELAADWESAGLPRSGRNLDLWEANRIELCAVGVPEHQIHVSELCTIEGGRFFSYRGGDRTARNMAVLMI